MTAALLMALWLSAASLAVASRAQAQGCCGGTPQGSLSTVTRLPPEEAGDVVLSLDGEYRALGTPARTTGPDIAPLLDQRVVMFAIAMSAEVGLTSRASVVAALPIVVNRESVRLPSGTTLDGTAAGIGDGTIAGKFRVLERGAALEYWPTLAVIGGVRIPTGPYRLEDTELGVFAPQIQPGSGAWAWLGGVTILQPLTDQLSYTQWNLYGSAAGRYAATNPRGYRFGPSLSYEIGGAGQFWRELTVQLGIAGYLAVPDRLDDEPLDNTGSHQLAAAATVLWGPLDLLTMYLGGQVPVWRSLRGTQLVGQLSITTGVQVRL